MSSTKLIARRIKNTVERLSTHYETEVVNYPERGRVCQCQKHIVLFCIPCEGKHWRVQCTLYVSAAIISLLKTDDALTVVGPDIVKSNAVACRDRGRSVVERAHVHILGVTFKSCTHFYV